MAGTSNESTVQGESFFKHICAHLWSPNMFSCPVLQCVKFLGRADKGTANWCSTVQVEAIAKLAAAHLLWFAVPKTSFYWESVTQSCLPTQRDDDGFRFSTFSHIAVWMWHHWCTDGSRSNGLKMQIDATRSQILHVLVERKLWSAFLKNNDEGKSIQLNEEWKGHWIKHKFFGVSKCAANVPLPAGDHPALLDTLMANNRRWMSLGTYP